MQQNHNNRPQNNQQNNNQNNVLQTLGDQTWKALMQLHST